MQKDIFLNDVEIAKVEAFCKDTVLKEAVRKVLLAGVYHNGTLRPGVAADPLRNFALALVAGKAEYSNEQVGADLRACMEGVRMVENGFKHLDTYKEVAVDKKEKKNIAR